MPPIDFCVDQWDTPTFNNFFNVTNPNYGGGTPKFVMNVFAAHNAANDPSGTADARIVLGAAAASSNQRTVCASSFNGQAATLVSRGGPRAQILTLLSSVLGGEYSIDHSQFIQNGVEFRSHVNMGIAHRNFNVYMGGNGMQAAVGQIGLVNTTNVQTVGSLPFLADALILFGSNSSADANFLSGTFGVALRDGTQMCISWAEDNAVAAGGQPSLVFRNNRGACQQSISSSSQDYDVIFSNFTPTSFDFQCSAGAAGDGLPFAMLRFGENHSCKLRELTTPISLGQVHDNTWGFNPKFGLSCLTNLEAANAGQFNDNLAGGFGIGAFTMLDQQACSWSIDASADPTATQSLSKAVAVLSGNGTGPEGVSARLASFNRGGLSLDYTIVQGAAKKGFLFLVGDNDVTPMVAKAKRFMGAHT